MVETMSLSKRSLFEVVECSLFLLFIVYALYESGVRCISIKYRIFPGLLSKWNQYHFQLGGVTWWTRNETVQQTADDILIGIYGMIYITLVFYFWSEHDTGSISFSILFRNSETSFHNLNINFSVKLFSDNFNEIL